MSPARSVPVPVRPAAERRAAPAGAPAPVRAAAGPLAAVRAVPAAVLALVLVPAVVRAVLAAVLVPAVVLVAAPAARADGEPSLAASAVRTTPGRAQFYLTARDLPAGASLETARITVRAGDTPLPVAVEPAAGGAKDGKGNAAQAPARSVVIVFDASLSMAGPPLAQAQDAALRYARAVPADVRIGLVRIGDRAETVLPPTADRAAFTAAVRGLRAAGATALYDAVAEAHALSAREKAGDRRLLVLSDGSDTSSQTGLEALTRRLSRDGAVVEVVAFGDRVDVAALGRIASAGGEGPPRLPGEELASAFLSAAAAFSPPVLVTVRVPGELAGQSARLTVEARPGGPAGTPAPAPDPTATTPAPVIDPTATPPGTAGDPPAAAGGTWAASTTVSVTFAAPPHADGPAAPPPAATVAGPPDWLYPAGGGALLASLALAAAALTRPRRGLEGGRLAQLERFTLGRTAPAGGTGAGVLNVPGAALALTEKVVRARGGTSASPSSWSRPG
ncbi:vWA domain-containing protein [Planobispora longispora]|uniref:vWA domain-containing protein n=1 Tax=Planobispora longispora TaxID=28887 RepID=UPI00361D5CDA